MQLPPLTKMHLQQEKVFSAEFVQETVAKYFNIDAKDLRGSKRNNEVAFPRQIAMYLCRKVAQMSLPQIGKDFGKRDHTTVMHACTKIEQEIKKCYCYLINKKKNDL